VPSAAQVHLWWRGQGQPYAVGKMWALLKAAVGTAYAGRAAAGTPAAQANSRKVRRKVNIAVHRPAWPIRASHYYRSVQATRETMMLTS